MLYSQRRLIDAYPSRAVVVFLHGLLGSGEDWQSCLATLPNINTLCIDLPGHGGSQAQACLGFESCCALIAQTIRRQIGSERPVLLVGYSLGGRIAMYGAAFGLFHGVNLQGLLIEGGNFGLDDDAQRSARWHSDNAWAQRFEQQPIADVLNAWYQQAVFSSLNDAQRQTLVEKRSANLGAAIAMMLRSTSLAKQPHLLAPLLRCGFAAHYICGIKDQKFSAIARQSGLSFSQVDGAGHNVHHEQPNAFADLVLHHLQAVNSRA